MRANPLFLALMCLLLTAGGVLGFFVVNDAANAPNNAPPRAAQESAEVESPQRPAPAPLPEPEIVRPADKPVPAPEVSKPAAVAKPSAEEQIRQKVEAMRDNPSEEEMAKLKEAIAELIKHMGDDEAFESSETPVEAPKFPFEFTATISGTVVDATGVGVAGAQVYGMTSGIKYVPLANEKEDSVRKLERRSAAPTRLLGTTDAAGNFKVEFKLGGQREISVLNLSIWAKAANGTSSTQVHLALANKDTKADNRLELPATGALTGRVVDVYGLPLAGARVMAVQSRDGGRSTMGIGQGGSANQWFTTDSEGRFRMEALTPQEYSLSASLPGYVFGGSALTVTVVAGRETSFPTDVVMKTVTALKVTVTCPERNPAGQNLTASFFDASGNAIRTKSYGAVGKDGVVLFPNAPTAALFFSISGGTYEATGQLACSIKDGMHNDYGTVALKAIEMPKRGSVRVGIGGGAQEEERIGKVSAEGGAGGNSPQEVRIVKEAVKSSILELD